MDYSFVVSEDRLTITHKHDPPQIILSENTRLSGFGKSILFYTPFLFINEPYSREGGKVWIYQLMRINPYSKQKTFQVLHQLTRPKYLPNLPGFGSFIYYHEHMLFIIDRFGTNYRGTLYYYYCGHNLQVLYEHTEEPECLQRILKIQNRRHNQFHMTLSVMNRKTGSVRNIDIVYERPKLMKLLILDEKLAIT